MAIPPPPKPRNYVPETIFLLGLSWVLLLKANGLAFFFPFVLLGGLLWLIAKRRYVLSAMLLFLSPLTFSFATGVKDYFLGYPTLMYMGLPSIETHNIDAETRCIVSTGGCVVRGYEWIYQDPNNFAVRMLARIFGPPTKSYDGPYPTKEQAISTMTDSQHLSAGEFKRDSFTVGSYKVDLEPGVGERIIEGLRFMSSYQNEDCPYRLARLTIQAAVYQERCLIIRLTEHYPLDDPAQPIWADYIVLFDRDIGLPFAYYLVQGEESNRLHPVTFRDRDGVLAFVRAARRGDERVLGELIRKGSDVNRRNRVGQTVLMIAAQEGHVDVVKYLIDQSADLNLKDNNGYTALVSAIARSRPDVAKTLLEHGADVRTRDFSRMTPLMHAASGGDLEVVKLLVHKGADPEDRDGEGRRAGDFALQRGNIEILQYLTKLVGEQ